jgi:hypothetical protein
VFPAKGWEQDSQCIKSKMRIEDELKNPDLIVRIIKKQPDAFVDKIEI